MASYICTDTYDEHGDEYLRCSECGHVDTDEGFDVLGAAPGNLFCLNCNAELSCGPQ